MSLNFFTISSVSLILTSFVLLIVLLIYGKTKLHRICAMFNFSVFVWAVGTLLISLYSKPSQALIGWKIAVTGGLFIAVLFYHTAYIVGGLLKKKILVIIYSQAAMFWLVSCFAKEQIVYGSWQPVFNSFIYPSATTIWTLMAIIWCTISLLGHYELLKFVKRSKGLKRTQGLYLLLGFAVGFLGGGSVLLPAWGISLYPIGNFGIAIYSIVMTYAILAYRLMDIKVVIARSFILACVYAPIILISLGLKLWAKDFLYAIFGDKWLLVPLGTFGALSFAGSFAYLFFQQKYDQKRFRQQNAQLSHLKEATRTAIEVHWENLLKNIPAFVTQLYRQEFNTDIEYAAVYFYDKKRAEYILFSYKAKKVDTAYLPKSILKTDPMPDWFGRAIASQTNIKNPALSESIKYEELEYLKDHLTDLNLIDSLEKLKRSMEKLRADVCTYCFYQDRLLAFMLLGKRQKGSYSEGEINTFSLLSHDISMAIRSGEQQDEVVKSHLDALVAVGTALEEKDAYTKGHSERVARYGQAIAIELVDVFPYTRIYDLPEKTHLAGLLHDIGKIGVLDSILLKPGKLTEEEFKSLQKHPLASLHIIQSLGSISEEVRDGIESHHEKYDGTGYGKGAKGHRIPPIARIIAVVDAYDAMTSDRPYRKAMSEEVAKEEINRVSGTQFDPKAVEAFNKAYAKGKLKRDIS